MTSPLLNSDFRGNMILEIEEEDEFEENDYEIKKVTTEGTQISIIYICEAKGSQHKYYIKNKNLIYQNPNLIILNPKISQQQRDKKR